MSSAEGRLDDLGLGPAGDPDLVTARLQLALEAAQLGLWDWWVASGELVWDARSRLLLGLAAQAVSGTISDIEQPIHPDDLPAVQAALQQAIDTAGSVDVTYRAVWPGGEVHWIRARGSAMLDAQGAVQRLIGTNADVTADRELAELRAAAAAQRTSDAERMAALVTVAQSLGETHTESDVVQVVAAHGLSLLDAAGAVLCLPQPTGRIATWTTGVNDAQVRAEIAGLPADFPLPMIDASTTGRAHFYDDRAAAVAAYPAGAALYARVGIGASAAVPLLARGHVLGSLALAWGSSREWRSADRELLTALAALIAQAVDRIRARSAEQEATRAARRLSETLQRSLLTDPPEPNVLQIAARYQPAAQDAQVGGDWHDAFVVADGSTTVVIGDVAGHDGRATAAMAQVRNVLRGVAQSVDEPPAIVLAALDQALSRLRFPALTTAVLAQVTQSPAQAARGEHLLRWCNAGHPPPVLIGPDGVAELLWRPADLLLGVDPDAVRTDHEVLLPAGATVLLYTDGLTERRGEPLDVGLEQLRTAAGRLAHLRTDGLADALLGELGHDAEDDVALLVLRPGR